MRDLGYRVRNLPRRFINKLERFGYRLIGRPMVRVSDIVTITIGPMTAVPCPKFNIDLVLGKPTLR